MRGLHEQIRLYMWAPGQRQGVFVGDTPHVTYPVNLTLPKTWFFTVSVLFCREEHEIR